MKDETSKRKTCIVCLCSKPIDQFGRSRSTHDGLLNVCRSCVEDLDEVVTPSRERRRKLGLKA